MPETKPTVVVLTALPSEFMAVRKHLKDTEVLEHRKGTLVERGRLPDSAWHVAVAELGAGAQNAAALTERIVDWLDPEALLFVGVAGGLQDDIALGDVVVGTKVYGIHGGKQTPEGFQVRPEAWRSSYRLEQAARFALRDLPVHFKPIAVGDVVLADAESAIAAYLRLHYNDAAAIETEGSGVAHAAHLSDGLDALVIRGIGNHADAGKPEADTSGSQPQAAERAAEALVAVLRRLQPFRGRSSGSGSGDSEEGPHGGSTPTYGDRGPTYGGGHYDFRGSTFNGPFVAKQVGRERREDDRR
ncbi:5'-methylthioadenosine/S-adenosylhomocysteine nucleosidase [Streptomyces graminofaciens]|uniref:5'-methylthioadenosine/S-adenosylhomocysteine nucleosidase family protein n=1 Tax=Streptomyces graminofaciens TaxID=68212 RepID=UPI0025742521|nr:5'-methylthioadenosine/S-adenosylhomocysteine nucleosidase [Streptomyces graminofaciens]